MRTRKMMTSKSITELKPDYTMAMDIRGEPTSICICGSFVWNLKVSFSEDGTIGMYFRDMECADCGTQATAPIEE
jgi:hypothetical protein